MSVAELVSHDPREDRPDRAPRDPQQPLDLRLARQHFSRCSLIFSPRAPPPEQTGFFARSTTAATHTPRTAPRDSFHPQPSRSPRFSVSVLYQLSYLGLVEPC